MNSNQYFNSNKVSYLQSGGMADVFKYNNWAVKVFHSKEKADREIDIIRSSTILRQNDIIFPHLMRYDNIRTLLKQTIIGWYQHLGLKQKLNNFIKNYKKYLHIQVLFMEYIPGVDLLEFCISKNEKWSPNLAEEVTLQMLKATMECHQAGFIHRDIKPENFMINITYKNNQEIISVKLVDFGLATPIICDKNKIFEIGIGTPIYQSHEAKQGIHSVYSDLAAVGLSMLELTKYDIRSPAFESFLRYISQDVPQSRGSVQEALDMLITLMDDALLDEDESSSLF